MTQLLLVVSYLAPVTLFAQDGGAFILQGKMEGRNNPDKLFLVYRDNNRDFRDSVALKEGAFKFTGNVSQPQVATLLLRHATPMSKLSDANAGKLTIYLEKGIITIEGKDAIATATVKGSELNEGLQRFIEKLKPVCLQGEQLMAEYTAASEEKRNSAAFKNALKVKGHAIQQHEKKVLLAFIKENPGTLISLNVLQYFAGTSPDNADELEKLFNGLSAVVKNSAHGKEMVAMIRNRKQAAAAQ